MCYWCKCELVTQLIFIGFQWQRSFKTQYFLHLRLKRLQSHIHKILFINNLPAIPKVCPRFQLLLFFVLFKFLFINCFMFNNSCTIGLNIMKPPWFHYEQLWNHLSSKASNNTKNVVGDIARFLFQKFQVGPLRF